MVVPWQSMVLNPTARYIFYEKFLKINASAKSVYSKFVGENLKQNLEIIFL
jgi:hypothetical protein